MSLSAKPVSHGTGNSLGEHRNEAESKKKIVKSKKKKIGGGVATVGKVGEGVDRKRPVTLAHLGKAVHCYKNCLLINKSEFTLRYDYHKLEKNVKLSEYCRKRFILIDKESINKFHLVSRKTVAYL